MKNVRLYGLFRRTRGERQWERLHPTLAFKKESAIRIFQSALLDGTFAGYEMRLRPVKATSKGE